MKKINLKKENYAFIDSQNLNLGVRSLGWRLDWRKLRQYLAMIEYKNFNKAIIVSGDGDFYYLVEYLEKKGKLGRLLIPNEAKFSRLLYKFVRDIDYVSSLRVKLGKNIKRGVLRPRTKP